MVAYAFNPRLLEVREADLWDGRQPGLLSEFRTSEDYIVIPSLNQKENVSGLDRPGSHDK